jgi:hypothetical protein
VVIVVTWGILAIGVSAASAATPNDGSTPAPASIVQLVTHVPASTLNRVGAGDIAPAQFFKISRLQGHLARAGKPEVLTVNLGWCPHCAANSWGLAIALSRFGTLTGLRTIDTGTHYCLLLATCSLTNSPCAPHTHGLSFLDARLRSRYVSFAAVVVQDVDGNSVENPTKQETAAIGSFDPFGMTPAVDVGGDFGFVNSSFDPAMLAHESWTQIAGSLSNPHNRIARRIDGLANVLSAAICTADGGRPGRVCKSPGVLTAGAAHLQ